MSDHKLAEALRACLDVLNELPTWSNAGHAVKLGNEALRAHEAEQQAGEAVMIYHGQCTIDCGENGHHNVELLRLIPAGTKLFAHPQQPLTEEQIRLERKRIDPMAEDMDAWSFGQGVRFAERAHGITKDTK